MQLEEFQAEAIERARSTGKMEWRAQELCDAHPPPTRAEQHDLLHMVEASRGKLFRDLHTCPETLDPTLERLRGIYAGDLKIGKNMRISKSRLTCEYYRMQLPARLARVAEVVSDRDLADAIADDGDAIADALGGLLLKTKVVKATIEHGSANHSARSPRRTRGVRRIHQVRERYDAYSDNVWKASCHNARLVYWGVKKFINNGVSFGQLFQEGMIIAHRATDYFDLANDVGSQFQTYLARALESGLHKVVKDEWRQPGRTLSFRNEDGGNVMAVELTHDFRERDPAERDAITTEMAAIEPMLNDLSHRERDILNGYFGLGQHDGVSHTQEELGQMHGVTRGAIQNTVFKALRKIKKKYVERYGDAPVLQ